MTHNLNFEQLEQRRLLAVSVTTGKQGLLSFVGDGVDDLVVVTGTGVAGEVDVFANGGFVGTFSGVKTIKANLKGGDDILELSAIHIGGAVDVDMGQGEDIFVIDTFAPGGEGQGFAGDVFIGGSVICKMGNNVDDIAVFDTDNGAPGFGITVGNNVTIAGAEITDFQGEGGSSAVQSTDVTIGGFLKVSSSVDGAIIAARDINVGGTTIVTLGAGDDIVDIQDCSFARRVEVSMGAGDDIVAVRDSISDADVVAKGGKGDDILDTSMGNDFALPPVVTGFEIVII
jgi:hypothetical protein